MSSARGRLREDREAKRARQACENCRRKKTRCSGERPACRFCERLGQTCVYNGRINTGVMRPESPTLSGGNPRMLITSVHNADLAARLALIESRLGLGGHDTSPEHAAGSNVMQFSPRNPAQSADGGRASDHSASTNDTSKFSTVPPLSVLEAMADVYFTSCHNQPYCFFLESSFRQHLIEGSLPEYLLMAFVATSARYSSHAYFENRQSEALDSLAKMAWHIVLKQVFSSEQGLDLHAVQATHMLAVIDFTAGHHRLGWVKIGLAVRFAQGLRLNAEPDATIPVWEQEEQRRTFWSVYILDRFVSCCRARPPSILDDDCTVMLPTTQPNFSADPSAKSPTLAILKNLPDVSACKSLNHFALFVLATSTLGRIVRYNSQQSTTKSFPPWDFRSDFAKISTILLSFETLFSTGDLDLTISIRDHSGTYEGLDKPWEGMLIWARGVYHLSCCLLHHPLFLYRHLQHHRDSFPKSFARASLRHCQEHAKNLTNILRVVIETRCCARGSFLGYFAVVAGSVNRLYERSIEPTEQARAQQLLQICLDFLEQGPVYWGSYPRMAAALRELQVKQTAAQALIEPDFLHKDIESMQLESLSRILDYGWLCDAHRSDQPSQAKTPQNANLGNWSFFEDLVVGDVEQSDDIVGLGMNALFQNKSGRATDWWFDTGYEDTTGSGQMVAFHA